MKPKFRLLVLYLFGLLCLLNKSTNSGYAQIVQRSQPLPADVTIIEGDIVVSKAFAEDLQRQGKQSPKTPTGTYAANRWPGGDVPFEFDANVTASNQTAMLTAMTILESVPGAGINFFQCAGNSCTGAGQTAYVHIQNDTGNFSYIGRTGGQQQLGIAQWQFTYIIVHELMHCLGFWHEHTRPDRDTYIQINCANVIGGCSGNIYTTNFPIQTNATTYGNYDFDSVMHYGQCTFSNSSNCPADGSITITVKPPYNTQWQNNIGQLNHLSALDQQTLAFLYPGTTPPPPTCTNYLNSAYNGSNGTSDGTATRPYTTFAQAVSNTTAGGTICISGSQVIPAVGTHSKNIRVTTINGIMGTLGQ